jgi:hypothetical protein
MFNTIKSGIAVDYPIMTGSFKVAKDPKLFKPLSDIDWAGNMPSEGLAAAIHTASGYYITEPKFHHRIPFEAIISPNQYIADLRICNAECHPSGASGLHLTASVGTPVNSLYRLAANNFFAEVPDFFLENNNMTALTSLPESDANFGKVMPDDIRTSRKFSALVKLRKSFTKDTNFNAISASYDSNVGRIGGFNVHELGVDEPLPTPWSLDVPTINMYSRPSAFGPPSIGLWGSNAGYNMPYTPPYYDGAAWAYLEFTPEIGSKKYTLDEIMEYTKVIYTRAGRQTAKQIPTKHGSTWGDGTKRQADGLHVPNWPWSRPINDNAAPVATAQNLLNGNGQIIDKVANFFDPYPQGRDLIDENAMQLSSSVNMFQKANIKTTEYDAITGLATSYSDDPNADLKTWVIQTKFETPILNFQKSSSAGRAYEWETSAYGMWHQYGTYPENESDGIFLEIVDTPKDFLTRGLGKTESEANMMGSLADLVGFNTAPAKVGVPASAKTISEAIVAVPFIEKDAERYFFNIPRVTADEAYSRAIGNMPMSPQEGPDFVPGDSIVDMVRSMIKYVFPPKMDFITNSSVEPFAMYIFEFSTTLDREDVTDIWQNVLPKIGRSFEHQTVSVSHDLNVTELMGYDSISTGKKMQDKLQWMVFKVKQKAQKNYYDKVVGTSKVTFSNELSDDISAAKGVNSKSSPITYSYNWPYDYFSLVELAKIDSTVEYGEDPEEILERVVTETLEDVEV